MSLCITNDHKLDDVMEEPESMEANISEGRSWVEAESEMKRPAAASLFSNRIAFIFKEKASNL